MTKELLAVLALGMLSATAFAGERKLIASDLAGVGIRKGEKITIRNDRNSIQAVARDGNVSRTLVAIRATLRPLRQFADGFNTKVVEAPADLVLHIREAAQAAGVDHQLVTAVVRQESAFNPRAVSPVGAEGLMQLMPATARSLGVSNSFDARQNLFGGAKYLRHLLDSYKGNLDLTLAAYNAGPGNVARYRGVPPFAETENYVARVRGDYERRSQGR